MKRSNLSACVLTLLAFGAVQSLFAQSMGTGTIAGTVIDPSGASIGGAQITAVNLGTRAARSTSTNDQGQ